MRSISSGGQPCSVLSVMELDTRAGMLSTKAASTLVKRAALSSSHSRHSLNTGVEAAFFMPSM